MAKQFPSSSTFPWLGKQEAPIEGKQPFLVDMESIKTLVKEALQESREYDKRELRRNKEEEFDKLKGDIRSESVPISKEGRRGSPGSSTNPFDTDPISPPSSLDSNFTFPLIHSNHP
jgi:hypothetical protein